MQTCIFTWEFVHLYVRHALFSKSRIVDNIDVILHRTWLIDWLIHALINEWLNCNVDAKTNELALIKQPFLVPFNKGLHRKWNISGMAWPKPTILRELLKDTFTSVHSTRELNWLSLLQSLVTKGRPKKHTKICHF